MNPKLTPEELAALLDGPATHDSPDNGGTRDRCGLRPVRSPTNTERRRFGGWPLAAMLEEWAALHRFAVAKLILAFTVIPLTDLALTIYILGPAATALAALATAALGGVLVNSLGLGPIKGLSLCLARDGLPGEALLKSALVLVAGFLLLAPGMATDLAGLALVLPGTSQPATRTLRLRLAMWLAARRGGPSLG